MIFGSYSIALLFVSFFMLIFYAFLWPRRRVRGVRSLAWIFFVLALWCLGAAFRQSSLSYEAKLIWAVFSLAWAATAPLLLLFFIVEYCGYEKHFQRAFLRGLWIFPVVVGVAALTNETHQLLWSKIVQMDTRLIFRYGPVFWLYIGYVFFCVVVAFAVLVRTIFVSKGILRRQLLIFLVAALLPLIPGVLYIAKIHPFADIDISPAAFALSTLLIGYNVLYCSFLDIIPVAHHTVFETIRDGVMVLDGQNRVIDCNSAMMNYFGHKLKPGVFLRDIPGVSDDMFEALSHEAAFETEIYHAAQNRFFELRMTPMKGSLGRIIILNDTTERKHFELELVQANAALSAKLDEISALHAKLKEQALKDSLTGLYNRRFLDDILQKELSRARRKGSTFALVMIDIDHFKELNDTLGHDFGDRALQKICTVITDNIRESDYACRYGGDEMIVLLTNITPEHAHEKAEQFRTVVEELFMNEKGGGITLSVGVAVYPEDGTDTLHIFKHADKALYRAKNEGRNRVVMYSA